MPSVRYYRCLALRAYCAKEVDRLVVTVVLTYRQNHVTYADVERTVYKTCDVELLESNLTALFHFCLILSILRVLQLVCSAYAACLELYLNAQRPLAVEAIVAGKYKAWHGNGVAGLLRVALGMTVVAVCAIILECSYQFAVAADAELFEVFVLSCEIC